MPALPKLSYVLLSHNRENYIRQALESAFAQDYEGELEYIISDDCSTDRTFDIIRECVAAYQGGRRVVVTRTPRNLHLAGNTNHAMQFVESDWIVRADDDDISAIDRCTLVGKAIARFPKATMVFGRQIDFSQANEEEVRARASRPSPAPLSMREESLALPCFFRGLHQTWSMKHFREFGPLPQDGQYVDDLIALYRSCMLGSGVEIDAVLAYIRCGSGNMCRGGDTGGTGYHDIIRRERFTQMYQDTSRRPLAETLLALETYASHHPATPHSGEIIAHLRQSLKERDLLSNYWETSCSGRLQIRRQMGSTGFFSLLRCLPLPLFAAALATYRTFVRK